MGTLVVAVVVLFFGILSLYSPKVYRKVLAPLCFRKEDELPPFPRAAAVGLILTLSSCKGAG
jgi:hypothetical protein